MKQSKEKKGFLLSVFCYLDSLFINLINFIALCLACSKVLKSDSMNNGIPITMSNPDYLPPPPPPENDVAKGFHGPETHFFTNIRANLTILEKNSNPSIGGSLKKSLIVGLILGASISLVLSLVLELALSAAGVVGFMTIFPLFEEFAKGLSIFTVAYFLWKGIPSRRYGALLGASVGFGFAIIENIIFNVQTASAANATGGQIAEAILARWVGLPFMHVLWSAFVGMGLFVLLAQRKGGQGTPSWLAVPLLAFGWVAHMCWNAFAIGFGAVGLDIILLVILNVVIVFVPFALIFRDFLGGHFNFQNFLGPVSEPMSFPAENPMPPPPPPL
jgi:RsiW-degrading membrane proteinase PrsW (M82 family)